ncbi:MAG: glycosyltransferase [Ignavibacteria bacterium]
MSDETIKLEGTIIWLAPFYNRTGFGMDARGTVLALHRIGVKIKIVPVNNIEEGIDDVDLELIKSLENTPIIPPITYIVSHVADKSWLQFKLPEPNLKIIATTVIADVSSPPKNMLDACREFDQVWVMSEHERQVLITNGFLSEKIKIVWWPHPWIENSLIPVIKPEPTTYNMPFCFLNISLFLPRRRWDTLIEAYLEEFKRGENVELYLKVNYPPWHPIPGKPKQDLLNLIQELRIKTGSEASIIIDDNLGKRTELINLIDSCNVYVSTDTAPTSPVAEARARRRAVIIPNSYNYGADSYIGIDCDNSEKISFSQEMLMYMPNHKDTLLSLLRVDNVRSALRKAFNLSPEERYQISEEFSHLLGPKETLPNIIDSIKAGWEYKNSLKRNVDISSSLIEHELDNNDLNRSKNSKVEDRLTVNKTGMNKLRFDEKMMHGFSNRTAAGKLPSKLPSPLALNLGCGNDVRERFLNIDLFSEDTRVIAMDIRKLEFSDNSVDFILASDVLEHFSFREVDIVLQEWARVLKPNAEIIIRSPSLKLQAKAYLNGKWDADTASYMIFGGQTNPGDYHHIGFDKESIQRHLKKANLELKSYEEIDVSQDKGFCNLNFVAKAIKSDRKKEDIKIQKQSIVWEGAQFVYHSLALINREQCLRLIKDGYNVSIIPFEKDQFKPGKNSPLQKLRNVTNKKLSSVDIHVRHQWPPNLTAPERGHWVIIQPWEFGSLPKQWADVFSTQVDEMWVPSSYVKKIYEESGVPAERVFIVPNGADPNKFNPKAKPYHLKTKKAFKFLFVGGTIFRKGIDILLDVYTNAFTANDDVCLVIKDMGGDSFYKGQNMKSQINEIQKDKNAPEIEYIDKILPEDELIGLYTSSDVLVHPYRGEGFGFPILEAMACSIPAIVTNGGACLDFCNEENSLLVEAKSVRFENKNVGDMELVDNMWLFEPDKQDLERKMLYAFKNKIKMKAMGVIASEYVHSNFNWSKSSEILQARIKILSLQPVRRENINIEEQIIKKGSDMPIVKNENLDFNKSFLSAYELYEAKRFKDSLLKLYEAETYYENGQHKSNEVDLSDLNVLKGIIYMELNDLNNARKAFEEALSINPESSGACIGLCDLFYRLDLKTEAKTMIEYGILYDPKNQDAPFKLAVINQELGFPDNHNSLIPADSVKDGIPDMVNEAYELFLKKEYNSSLSKLLFVEDNLDEIVSAYKKDEFIVIINNLKGFNYLALNKAEKAKICYEKALSFDPQSSQAYAGLGEILFLNGKDSEAKIMFEKGVKNNPDNQFAVGGLQKVNQVLGLSINHNSLD